MEDTGHIEHYYTTLENMLARHRSHYREYGYRGDYSKRDVLSWQSRARERLSELLGMETIEDIERPDFSPICTERADMGSTVREKVYITSEEGVAIPMYILLPKGKSKGTYLALCGHQGAGKESIAGVREHAAVIERIDKYSYDYGLKLAELGYTVICPDSRGYGERREHYMQGDEREKYLRSSCRELQNIANALGFSLIGLMVFDVMRIIDYLETREDIDTTDVGLIGFSGGAMQGLYASALEPRIKKLFLSGYFYGFADALILLNNNCSCNYPHGIFRAFDMCDLLSLSAPKRVVLQTSKADHLNGYRGLENVREQMDETNRVYAAFGERLLALDIGEGDHSFHAERLGELISLLG